MSSIQDLKNLPERHHKLQCPCPSEGWKSSSSGTSWPIILRCLYLETSLAIPHIKDIKDLYCLIWSGRWINPLSNYWCINLGMLFWCVCVPSAYKWTFRRILPKICFCCNTLHCCQLFRRVIYSSDLLLTGGG